MFRIEFDTPIAYLREGENRGAHSSGFDVRRVGLRADIADESRRGACCRSRNQGHREQSDAKKERTRKAVEGASGIHPAQKTIAGSAHSSTSETWRDRARGFAHCALTLQPVGTSCVPHTFITSSAHAACHIQRVSLLSPAFHRAFGNGFP
jgi:hypothetical protein